MKRTGETGYQSLIHLFGIVTKHRERTGPSIQRAESDSLIKDSVLEEQCHESKQRGQPLLRHGIKECWVTQAESRPKLGRRALVCTATHL